MDGLEGFIMLVPDICCDQSCIFSSRVVPAIWWAHHLASIKKSHCHLHLALCFPLQTDPWVSRVMAWTNVKLTRIKVLWRYSLLLFSFLPASRWRGWKFKIHCTNLREAETSCRLSTKITHISFDASSKRLAKVNKFQRILKSESTINTAPKHFAEPTPQSNLMCFYLSAVTVICLKSSCDHRILTFSKKNIFI